MKKILCFLSAGMLAYSALIAQTDTGFVTLNKNETITGVKTFSPQLTGNGTAVAIVPRFTTTSNGNQLYGLDIANPIVSNPGGYTGISAMVARLRGGIIVEGAADISTVRTNAIIRGGDVAFTITKAGSANVPNQLIFKQTIGATATSSMVNSTIFLDTIHFSANTTSEGYSHVRLTPALIQTGYSGITRGLYITPVLTDVTNFRAVETNVSMGNGYQLYARGTAPSYFAGNVGIGISNPQSLLAVNGDITAKRVKVTTTGWSDYVFDSAYSLIPLHSVEAYIKQNKHLPDVPAAATVEKNGVDVGDTQALLLKKIEELTLYIIEQNKQVQELKQQMKELQEKVK